MKNCDSFLIFVQNLDCGCTLEPPQRVPPIYVFKQNKKNVYPSKPQFYNIKAGYRGRTFHGHVCMMNADKSLAVL